MARTFYSIEKYAPSQTEYRLLPFRFLRLDGNREIFVNDVGEFVIAASGTAQTLIATVTAFVSSVWIRTVLLALAWVALLYPSRFLHGELRLGGYFFLGGAVLFGIGFVTLNRKILQWMARSKTTWQAVLLSCVNLCAAVILAGPAIGATIIRTYPSGFAVQIRLAEAIPQWLLVPVIDSSFLNILTALAALAIFVMIALALIYRLFWPALSRLVYHLPEFAKELAEKRTTRLAFGATLMSMAVKPNWLSVLLGKLLHL